MLIYIIIERRNYRPETVSGTNSGRNVPGNSPGRCRNTEMLRETALLPGKNGNKPHPVRGGNDKRGIDMVNKVRVNIAGTPYAIATTDSEKYIQTLAKKLDEDITKLLDDNENLSVTKAAVFCAMDYLDEYRKSTGSAENMRSQIQDYIADAARAKLAEDKVRAENEVLQRENAALREQLAKLQAKAKAAAAKEEAAGEEN